MGNCCVPDYFTEVHNHWSVNIRYYKKKDGDRGWKAYFWVCPQNAADYHRLPWQNEEQRNEIWKKEGIIFSKGRQSRDLLFSTNLAEKSPIPTNVSDPRISYTYTSTTHVKGHNDLNHITCTYLSWGRWKMPGSLSLTQINSLLGELCDEVACMVVSWSFCLQFISQSNLQKNTWAGCTCLVQLSDMPGQ